MDHATTFDVIVVGAGSAGGALASRLSEDRSRSVALLEAGPDYGPRAADQPDLIRDARDSSATDHDWGHRGWVSALGREVPAYAGRVVGGSSATNNVIALRGHPADYDAWAAAGNPGWSFEEVLPSFCGLEDDLDFDSPWHGHAGPIAVHRSARLAPAQAAFVESCVRLGHALVEDHNAPGAVGAGPLPLNERRGIRQSVAITYLASARRRPNLTVRADTDVARVMIEDARAVGVRTAAGELLAARQVVLSAGAYGSAALLLRSGLGPTRHLEARSVPIEKDLPGVGANLHDHPLLRLTYTTAAEQADPPHQVLLTARSEPKLPQPDIQVFPAGPLVRDGMATLTLLVAVMKPRSRGRLGLGAEGPNGPPAIDQGLLAERHDLERLMTAVELARTLAATPPLAGHLGEELSPGPALDGERLRDWIRGHVAGYQHPVGSCRMGPADDPAAVVDHTGRVHGIERLSVIDASIMPGIPSANTNIPTLMLGEYLARRL